MDKCAAIYKYHRGWDREHVPGNTGSWLPSPCCGVLCTCSKCFLSLALIDLPYKSTSAWQACCREWEFFLWLTSAVGMWSCTGSHAGSNVGTKASCTAVEEGSREDGERNQEWKKRCLFVKEERRARKKKKKKKCRKISEERGKSREWKREL